jgi:hypothetical protein
MMTMKIKDMRSNIVLDLYRVDFYPLRAMYITDEFFKSIDNIPYYYWGNFPAEYYHAYSTGVSTKYAGVQKGYLLDRIDTYISTRSHGMVRFTLPDRLRLENLLFGSMPPVPLSFNLSWRLEQYSFDDGGNGYTGKIKTTSDRTAVLYGLEQLSDKQLEMLSDMLMFVDLSLSQQQYNVLKNISYNRYILSGLPDDVDKRNFSSTSFYFAP